MVVFIFPRGQSKEGHIQRGLLVKKKREKEDLGITKEDTSNKEHEKHLENENDDKEKCKSEQ